jgi:predicted RNase H-like HicB family nuclease
MPVVLKPAHTKLTAIIAPSDNAFVAFCPELDLVTEGATPDAALGDLIEMALDYSEQYAAELDRFSQSPSRAAHAPFVQALRIDPTPRGARSLFDG